MDTNGHEEEDCPRHSRAEQFFPLRLRFSFRTCFGFRISFRHSGFVIIDRYEAVRVNLPMQLRGFSIVLAVLIMCAGFLPGQAQSGSETGIEGIITINPARPGPVRADAPVTPLANTAFAVERSEEHTSELQ